MTKRKIALYFMAFTMVATLCLLSSLSNPAVSLQLVKVETNDIPDLGLTYVVATMRMTNRTSRPIFYFGDLNVAPFYKASVFTGKGWVASDSERCAVGADNWALSAHKSTDFRVLLQDIKSPLRVSVDYTQRSPLQRFCESLPPPLSRYIPSAKTNHTVSIVLQTKSVQMQLPP